MASVHLPHPRPCVWGWGQQDPGPPPRPGVLVAWQLCPRVPGPPPALPFFHQVWEALPRRAVHPGASTAVLQVRPSPPAATGQTEPSHPTRWCPPGPSSLSPQQPALHAEDDTEAPTLPPRDSRAQPLPLTTRETGRRAQPPASRPPGPETEPSRGCLPPHSCWKGWGLPDPTAGRTLPSAPEAHPEQG